MPMESIAALIEEGLANYHRGKFPEAAACFRQAAEVRPAPPEALRFLGISLLKNGEAREALAVLRRAADAAPDDAAVRNSLGTVLERLEMGTAADQAFREAVALDPGCVDAWSNLARRAAAHRDPAAALDALKHLFAADPDHLQGRCLEGMIRIRIHDLDGAWESFRRVAAVQNDHVEANFYLGRIALSRGDAEAAIHHLDIVMKKQPDHLDAAIFGGQALLMAGQGKAAATRFETLAAARPDRPDLLMHLGIVRRDIGSLTEAATRFHQALAKDPDLAPAWNNLGIVFKDLNRIPEAVSAFRTALARSPDFATAHSNLLLTMLYDPGTTDAVHAAEARLWWWRHGAPASGASRSENRAAPDRRLRIGYVSADFKRHAVSRFFLPLIRHHDRRRVEIFCYANVLRPDDFTKEFEGLADHWRPIADRNDPQVAETVAEDRIDILVDLSGHSAGNRLGVFARKPAPVQVTWLGYPATTGLPVMDYRIVDGETDPPETGNGAGTETLFRLDRGFLCYAPIPDGPVVNDAPVLSTGRVTFGSFNNLAKIGPAVIDAWSAILNRVPDARLILKCASLADPAVCRDLRGRFAANGISAGRLEFSGYLSDYNDHLALYHRVDIGLDPFPYNGTTTTCDALWMGVPVIALEGDRHAGRVGKSLLGRVGLMDLVADSPAAYVEIAVALAADPRRIQEIRASLRDTMAGSCLCDGPGFARAMEDAFRRMWGRWCAARPENRPPCAPSALPAAASDRAGVIAAVRRFPYWYHRIGLPHGVVTPGWAPLDPDAYGVPQDLSGLRVLDVGAWDGYWSFTALARGAREVVAIDDFSDFLGTLENRDRKAWETFDLCRELLGHSPERCRREEMSVYDVGESRLGRFDTVFFFGTLYHLRHPLLALDRLSAVCDGEIFVESAILDDFSPYRGGLGHGYPDQAVMEFYPGREYAANESNWWVPSLTCMGHLVRAAGFSRCRVWKLAAEPVDLKSCRGFAHGRKERKPR